jgi:hypothetical protein
MFPPVAPFKLRALVSHRLEADLPIPLEQLEWDCRAARTDSAEARVLAQAVRRERLARHLESLRTAQLFPTIVTTEAEAIASLAAHALGLDDSSLSTALILAGERDWLLAVLSGEMARSVRRIPFDPTAPDAAVRELRQILKAESTASPIQRIAWVGQPQAAEPMQELAELVDVPASVAVADLRDQSGLPVSPADVADYGPAIGLALAALRPHEHVIRLGGVSLEEESPHRSVLEALLRRPGRLAAASCTFVMLAAAVHLLAMRSETRRMETQLTVATSRPADDLDAKVQSMQRLIRYRIDVEGVMAEIAKVLPDSAIISSVQLSRERRLVLKGTSKDAKAGFALAEALSKSPKFKVVEPGPAAPGQGGEFTLTVEVAGILKLTGLPGRAAAWR